MQMVSLRPEELDLQQKQYRIMKQIFKSLLLVAVFIVIGGAQIVKAQSTVYFFVDFRFWSSEYEFTVNGTKGFTLNPEGKPVTKGSDTMMYNMCARKIVFEKSDSYVIAVDCATSGPTYHAELNLNLEEGETYYVLINATLKKPFYMELMSEADGQKLLAKAQKSKKYTINEDYTYKGE